MSMYKTVVDIFFTHIFNILPELLLTLHVSQNDYLLENGTNTALQFSVSFKNIWCTTNTINDCASAQNML